MDRMFSGIDDRVLQDRQEGDIAFYQALALKMEFVLKVVTVGVVACVEDDADRNRYTLEYELVRHNSLGDWDNVLNKALVGPPAQFFGPSAWPLVQDLTERVSSDDWRYQVVSHLTTAAEELGLSSPIGGKAALRQAFSICVQIRNRTKGHGATTAERCHRLCAPISQALETLVKNLALFQCPWAFVRRNLSGKYMVVPLLGSSDPFDYLRTNSETSLGDGVYLHVNEHKHIPLVFFHESSSDISLPNGAFRNKDFEVLSYITDETRREDGTNWLSPLTSLPPSETEGLSELEVLGDVLTNLPPKPPDHVPRESLEERLIDELRTTDRHPIVSLTGPGGIGKTTTAIAAIYSICCDAHPPYDVVVWLSARDIDLLEAGPKPVAAKVVTQAEIAHAATALIIADSTPAQDPEQHMQKWLGNGVSGSTTLFVLDNFETVHNPADLFKWIDTYIRPPNKVLVTTRVRDFVGDVPIEVGGMNDEEAENLLRRHANRLGIKDLLTSDYQHTLIEEAEGHPYVMKILLGQVAKEKRAVKPERIIGSSEELLTALFERTFSALKPAAKRVFLLLSSWRVFVPEVAVEAVALRPGNKRFDARGALEELRRYSLIEHVPSIEEADEDFVVVPLPAAIFGKRKLDTNPHRMEIQEDRKLLMEFGPGKRQDVKKAGIMPRVDRLVRGIDRRAMINEEEVDSMVAVLEYVAGRVPQVYLRLSELVRKLDESKDSLESAAKYLDQFLERAQPQERANVWKKKAEIYEQLGKVPEELNALAEAALATGSIEMMGGMVNQINNRLREISDKKSQVLQSLGLRELIICVAENMHERLDRLSATDCSRLAWLMLNLGDEQRARDVAKQGIIKDPENDHCQRLIERLDN